MSRAKKFFFLDLDRTYIDQFRIQSARVGAGALKNAKNAMQNAII